MEKGFGNAKKQIGVYIHVPYCKYRCHFCSFYLVPGTAKRVDEYFECVRKEVDIYQPKLADYEITTIYFGGGTPTYVEPEQITTLLSYVKEHLSVVDDVEVTVEGSPDSLTRDKLELFYNAGVSRISMGLQAWQDEILKYIGRAHDNKTFLQAFANAREVGFKNINVDLMYSFPKLTMEQWRESLEKVAKLGPEHISAYSLIVDEESTFGKLKRLGKFEPVTEEVDREMNHLAKDILNRYGYDDYEIANFAKPGFESKHNLSVWQDNDYIGFGASAAGRFEDYTYSNAFSLEKYIHKLSQNELVFQEREKQELDDLILLHILVRLRIKAGINFDLFKQKFGIDFLTRYGKEVTKLASQKLIDLTDTGITLTQLGRDVENQVNLEFV